MRSERAIPGFTLVEAMAVIAGVGLLLGVLIPTISSGIERARVLKGGTQVRQGAVAATLYAREHRERLPQVWAPIGPRDFVQSVYAFAGSRGTIDELGLDEAGADKRPLNPYLGEFGRDDIVEPMRDPLDRGAREALPLVRAVKAASMFELVGTSYVMNTHALDAVPCPYAPTVRTLTPARDARMPAVAWPARTWLIGDHAMYNYDGGADAGFLWRRGGRLLANVAFLDGHVRTNTPVAEGPVNETPGYTFYPNASIAGTTAD